LFGHTAIPLDPPHRLRRAQHVDATKDRCIARITAEQRATLIYFAGMSLFAKLESLI
jgi:hypothetical protein